MAEPKLSVTVPDERWVGLWPGGDEPVEVAVWDLTGPPPGGASPGPHLVVLPYLGGTAGLDRLAAVPGLRVVQTLTAGYENVLPYVPDGVTLCTAAGVHDASTAELAVGLTIAALRGLGEFARAATTGEWLSGPRRSLADRTVLLVGSGSVGGAIARRLSGFEVSLTRVGTRARDDDAGHVHGADELPQLLPRHDVVILAVPLTPATQGLVDKRFLAAMPDRALLVNVARGGVVVTDDLLAEVSTGRMDAALDVTDPEPLPPDHPLWRCPNVLISPHVGGNTSAFEPRARALLREQLTRFGAGRPLRNQVNAGVGRASEEVGHLGPAKAE
jgi:phosphoglycerate dehydrogenase-like enzyme